MARPRTLSSSVTVTRRGFLGLGAGSLAACTWATPASWAKTDSGLSIIFLNLVGGPSHLDTWDPKPSAPSDIRGPFRSIPTSVPGVWITELFPRMARLAHLYALVRSVYHDEAPIHETGQQLIQTGLLRRCRPSASHVSCRIPRVFGQSSSVLIPGPLGNTGVGISHGQDTLPDHLSPSFGPGARQLDREPALLREQYGPTAFGQSCLLARRLVEQGRRFVTVNMFDTVYNALSWDCHADGASLNVHLSDYQDTICPMFDAAYSALLLDLQSRGMLERTMVVAAGEFGRSPKINLRGGRDHWPSAWTVLFAGGSVPGGQVIGGTDSLGREPKDRPVHASAIANTMLQAAGAPWTAAYRHGEPITELVGPRSLSL